MLSSILIAKTSSNGQPTWLPLSVHLLDTAGVMRRLATHWLSGNVQRILLNCFPDEDAIVKLCIFVAFVHDVGKATPVFAARCLYSMPPELADIVTDRMAESSLYAKPLKMFASAGKTPHALAGEALLLKAGVNKTVAAVVGAHHGKPRSVESFHDAQEYIAGYDTNFGLSGSYSAWQAAQDEIIATALREAGYAAVDELPTLDMPAQVLLSGLLIMADWIASNERYFPHIDIEDTGETLDRETRVRRALSVLNLPAQWTPGNLWASDDLYRLRFDIEARAVQRTMADVAGSVAQPGIMVLEAPMGVGKTEAALAAAEILADRLGLTGVFFGLPTQATSNGIFPRVLSWARSQSDGVAHGIRLIHAAAEMNDDYRALFEGRAQIARDEDGVTVHEWFEGRKKALLDDFVVGTIDQLLMAALKQKHAMLRHLGLANKTVIIDECHAYDVYMGQYLERALSWLGAYRVPVIVLSATLPVSRRRSLVEAYLGHRIEQDEDDSWRTSSAYPLIVYSDGGRVKHRTVPWNGENRVVEIVPLADDMIANTLSDLLSDGGCAAVIVNTVSRAQECADALRAHFGEDCVSLHHACFIMPDRAEHENALLSALGKPREQVKRPHRMIVVGTSVLEQSLDYDVDVMISDLCPMDLLLQRMGRMHRHARPRPTKLATARCYVLGMDGDAFEGGSRAIYGDYLLMRTKALLPGTIHLPGDISPLVQRVYDPDEPLPNIPNGYEAAKAQWNKNAEKREQAADTFRVSPPQESKRRNHFTGWLDTSLDMSDRRGEATVRDGRPSVDVLLMRLTDEGRIAFLPWIERGRSVSADIMPSKEDAIAILKQRVRLPSSLCAGAKKLDALIDEMEAVYSLRMPAWRDSPWLRGELFLLLDNNLSATLCGKKLSYDRLNGLTVKKEEDVIAKE